VTDLSFGMAVGAVILTGTLVPRSDSGTGLTWLGSGDALLLQSEGRVVLVDGSPRPLQLLEALGRQLGDRRHIDAVVVTDPRSNLAGLLDVLDHYSVGEVLDVGCEYPSLTYARWRDALRNRHIPVYALRTGVSLRAGSSRITALGPDGVYPQPRDSVGLLRISAGGRTVLLAGAASSRELTEAVFRPVKLRADVLVTDAGDTVPAAFLRHVEARQRVRLARSSPDMVAARTILAF
jgi:beta-lactamase superfamily II metal-dependent hydrolase